jgi:hypothetical protein
VVAFLGIIAAAAVAFVLWIAGSRKTSPWHNGWFVFWVVILVIAICLAVAAAVPDFAEWLGGVTPAIWKRPPRLFTDRWRYTAEGMRSPADMAILQTTMPGTGYTRVPGERHPWTRFVILVACSRLSPERGGRELWYRFEAFLRQPPASSVVSAMTGQRDDLRWSRRATNRAGKIDAVLTPSEDDQAVAAARLELPDESSAYGRDDRYAMIILHFEPSAKDGKPAPALTPDAWEGIFTQVVELAQALGQFLSAELGLSVSGEPPANIAFQLEAQQDIGEMIDVAGLESLPGLSHRRVVIGYFISDHEGVPAATAVSQMTTDVLRYGLGIERLSGPNSMTPHQLHDEGATCLMQIRRRGSRHRQVRNAGREAVSRQTRTPSVPAGKRVVRNVPSMTCMAASPFGCVWLGSADG